MTSGTSFRNPISFITILNGKLPEAVKNHISVVAKVIFGKLYLMISAEPGYSIHLRKIGERLDLPEEERIWLTGRKELVISSNPVDLPKGWGKVDVRYPQEKSTDYD